MFPFYFFTSQSWRIRFLSIYSPDILQLVHLDSESRMISNPRICRNVIIWKNWFVFSEIWKITSENSSIVSESKRDLSLKLKTLLSFYYRFEFSISHITHDGTIIENRRNLQVPQHATMLQVDRVIFINFITVANVSSIHMRQ